MNLSTRTGIPDLRREAILLAPLVFVLALALAYAGTVALWWGLSARGILDFEYYAEAFARMFLACLVGAGVVAAWARGALLFDRNLPVSRRAAFWTLFAGFVLSALDPFNAISQEMNVIRYFTAGFLVAAGVVLSLGAVRAGERLLDRVAGLGLAAVFVLGAADELFELHEDAGGMISADSAQVMSIDTQDLTTLAVAALGIVLALVAFAGLKILSRTRFRVGRRHTLSVYIMCAACLTFMAAMLLDTYDWAVENGVNALLRTAFLDPVGATYAFLDSQDLIIRAANSLEEFLELTAAMLFLLLALTFAARRQEDTPG